MTSSLRCKYCGDLYASSERKDGTTRTLFMCGTTVKRDGWDQTEHCKDKVEYQEFLDSKINVKNYANGIIRSMDLIVTFAFGAFIGAAVMAALIKDFS